MNILISENHGVNPTISKCFLCGGNKNEIALLGKLPGDAKAPKEAVLNEEPCDQCKEYMKQGIIIISIDEVKSKGDMKNPYRTGGWCVVREEYIKRAVESPELLKTILERRVMFISDEAWEAIGLGEIPKGK